MGQQQLLVLGVVIVGLAVVVGIEAFGENRRKARQDQTVQLMVDLGAKAQLWKLTPPPLGGGGDGAESDFSAFELKSVGLTPTETQGSTEVILRTEYACLKVFPKATLLQVNALDTDCGNGTVWMSLYVRGTGEGDLDIAMRGDAAVRANGQ